MTKTAVVVLTFNEAIHLARCLESVRSFADMVYVIDSYSTDATVSIAEASGAVVLQHKFRHQADQFQWAMDAIDTDADWILRLDADEIIETDLALRIRDELAQQPADVVGVTFDRKHIFLDRWVRHGGRYPLTMLRLFRRGHGQIEQRWMDEHIVISGGRAVHFAGGFADHNLNDISYFTDKHNKYATREAVEVLNQRYGLFTQEQELTAASASPQAAFKRFVKERIYNRIPFTLSSTGYFLFRYIFQLGFLDGRSGLVYHFLQGYWYRFLVGAKVMEFDRVLKPLASRAERIDALRKLTGLALDAEA